MCDELEVGLWEAAKEEEVPCKKMLLTNRNVNRLRLMSPSTVSLDNRVGFIELLHSYGQNRTLVQIHGVPSLETLRPHAYTPVFLHNGESGSSIIG